MVWYVLISFFIPFIPHLLSFQLTIDYCNVFPLLLKQVPESDWVKLAHPLKQEQESAVGKEIMRLLIYYLDRDARFGVRLGYAYLSPHTDSSYIQIEQSSYPRYKNRAIARILHKFYCIVGYQSFVRMAHEAWYATIFPYLAHRLGETYESENPLRYLHSEDAFYRLYLKHGEMTAGQRRKLMTGLNVGAEQALYILNYVGCMYSQCTRRMHLKKVILTRTSREVILSPDDMEELAKLHATKICSG
jgi:hypothetical protein